MSLQQSKLYLEYIKSLGWSVDTVDEVNIIFKKIIFIGTLAKLQRPSLLPDPNKLMSIIKKHHIRSIAVEPEQTVNQEEFSNWVDNIKPHVKLLSTYYLPTKTIVIDLTISENNIFKNFAEAKQRAVRRAINNGVTIIKSNSINDLISTKNKSAGLFGFITTYGINKLWPMFAPKNAAILLAYSSSSNSQPTTGFCIGGILLLFWEKTAYYWIAGATKKGKKLFAPTLLVWEALKVSKKNGCRQFDFVGVWDDRMPGQFTNWKGFTKFKEGFGGKEIYYPIARLHR